MPKLKSFVFCLGGFDLISGWLLLVKRRCSRFFYCVLTHGKAIPKSIFGDRPCVFCGASLTILVKLWNICFQFERQPFLRILFWVTWWLMWCNHTSYMSSVLSNILLSEVTKTKSRINIKACSRFFWVFKLPCRTPDNIHSLHWTSIPVLILHKT